MVRGRGTRYLDYSYLLTDNPVNSIGNILGRWPLVHAINPKVQRAIIFTHYAHTIPHLQTIQVLAVLLQDCDSVVHDAIPGHHPRPRPNIGHCEGELQVVRTVRRHPDLNGARPLGNHALETHLEEFVRSEGAPSEDHAVVKVLGRTAKKYKVIILLYSSSLPAPSSLTRVAVLSVHCA